MEALDLCLSCKACSTDCPAGVDIADVKSQFTQEYYRGKLRPFVHYTIGWLPRWIPLLTRFSAIVNWGARQKLLRGIADSMGISGNRALPGFRPHRELIRNKREADFDPAGDTVLFADSFTKAFRPEVIPAAARVLQSSGSSVACAPDSCCGLTWISTGQREGAAKRMARLVERLDDGTDRPIVVLEPSCAAAIHDDGPKLLAAAPGADPARGEAAKRVAGRVQSFATAIRDRQRAGWAPTVPAPEQVVVQTHCHEHASFGATVQREVLGAWGIDRVVESSSCCGVAGNFGFERDHYETSMRVAEHSIAPALAAADPDAPVLTDGFSCTMQVNQLEPGRGSRHLAQLLDPASSDSALLGAAAAGSGEE
jgi:Fe-S oxidoreductase